MPVDRLSPLPLHYQLYSDIKKLFTTEYKQGDLLPTEIELVNRYSVGRGTVRSALRTLAEEGIIERIAGRGTFLSRDCMVRLKRYRVGVILSSAEFGNETAWGSTWVHHIEMINGLMAGEASYNFDAELIGEDSFSPAYRDLFDGFILFRYVAAGLPSFLSKPLVNIRYDVDIPGALRAIVDDAVSTGYTSVVYLGSRKKSRVETVDEAFAGHGRPPLDPAAVEECGGTPEEARLACAALLDRRTGVDCLICSTDLRAIGALQCLRERGRRVPEDVAVYGFDGIRKSEVTDPPLTTFAFDWRYPGLFAAAELRAALDGTAPPDYLPPRGRLVRRRSTR
jgi:DNA-binding transcriptional regulator YhcF (GntR family)